LAANCTLPLPFDGQESTGNVAPDLPGQLEIEQLREQIRCISACFGQQIIERDPILAREDGWDRRR